LTLNGYKITIHSLVEGPCQILNALLDKGFRSIRADIFDFDFARSNYAPEFADF